MGQQMRTEIEATHFHFLNRDSERNTGRISEREKWRVRKQKLWKWIDKWKMCAAEKKNLHHISAQIWPASLCVRFIFYLCPFSYHFAWFLTFHFHLQSLPWPAWKWTAADRSHSHSQSRPDQSPELSPGFICHLQTPQCTHTHTHIRSNATMRKLQVWQAKQQKKRKRQETRAKAQLAQREIQKEIKESFQGGICHLIIDQHRRRCGCRLSKHFHWGIFPFPWGVDRRLAARLATACRLFALSFSINTTNEKRK